MIQRLGQPAGRRQFQEGAKVQFLLPFFCMQVASGHECPGTFDVLPGAIGEILDVRNVVPDTVDGDYPATPHVRVALVRRPRGYQMGADEEFVAVVPAAYAHYFLAPAPADWARYVPEGR